MLFLGNGKPSPFQFQESVNNAKFTRNRAYGQFHYQSLLPLPLSLEKEKLWVKKIILLSEFHRSWFVSICGVWVSFLGTDDLPAGSLVVLGRENKGN